MLVIIPQFALEGVQHVFLVHSHLERCLVRHSLFRKNIKFNLTFVRFSVVEFPSTSVVLRGVRLQTELQVSNSAVKNVSLSWLEEVLLN